MKKRKGNFFVPNQGSLEGPSEQTEEPFNGEKLDDRHSLWVDIGGPLRVSETTDSGMSEEFKGGERLW